MTTNPIAEILRKVRNRSPLIHAITNPISINQCANAILAVGARPVMAEHPKEVREITASANALLLNLGNITDVRMKSMMISGVSAKKNHIPVVLDLVGIACSDLRRNYAFKLIKKCKPTVIKGNYSEIYALFDKAYKSSGVDSDKNLSAENIGKIALTLAKKYDAVILASGKTDIACDKSNLFHIKNGTPRLSQITGTGCVLGALTAGYLSVSPDINAVAAACCVLGISGELSETGDGNGSFSVRLMDNLSKLTEADIEKYLKIEVQKIDKI